MNGTTKLNRSKEFLQGYNACAAFVSKTHNPYNKETAWLYHEEWRMGWEKRFHGEDINSFP